MNQRKTETYSFRLSSKMKLELMKRSTELGMQPGEYLNELMIKDFASKAAEPSEIEQSFISKQFKGFTEKLLGFMVDKFDRRMMDIEQYSKQSSIYSKQSMYQSIQASERSKAAVIQSMVMQERITKEKASKDETLAAIDELTKVKTRTINDVIKKEMDSK